MGEIEPGYVFLLYGGVVLCYAGMLIYLGLFLDFTGGFVGFSLLPARHNKITKFYLSGFAISWATLECRILLLGRDIVEVSITSSSCVLLLLLLLLTATTTKVQRVSFEYFASRGYPTSRG